MYAHGGGGDRHFTRPQWSLFHAFALCACFCVFYGCFVFVLCLFCDCLVFVLGVFVFVLFVFVFEVEGRARENESFRKRGRMQIYRRQCCPLRRRLSPVHFVHNVLYGSFGTCRQARTVNCARSARTVRVWGSWQWAPRFEYLEDTLLYSTGVLSGYAQLSDLISQHNWCQNANNVCDNNWCTWFTP